MKSFYQKRKHEQCLAESKIWSTLLINLQPNTDEYKEVITKLEECMSKAKEVREVDEVFPGNIEIRGRFIKIGKNSKWFKKKSIVEVYPRPEGGSYIILSHCSGSVSFPDVNDEEILESLETNH